MTLPPDSLPFSSLLLDRTVATLRHVYEVNRDHTDVDLGHDETSHGVLLYKSTNHFLPGNVANLPGVRSEIDSGSLRVRERNWAFRCFRIGYTEHDDPWRSFPHNRSAAPAMAAGNVDQLRLFEELGDPRAVGGLEYIVGHCGNALGGLRAVHVCLPLGRADERVRQWLRVTTIYRADQADGDQGIWPAAPQPSTPPAEGPVVRLRPTRREAIDGER